jgi:hypothetical protein
MKNESFKRIIYNTKFRKAKFILIEISQENVDFNAIFG